jgi:hypothetical protein
MSGPWSAVNSASPSPDERPGLGCVRGANREMIVQPVSYEAHRDPCEHQGPPGVTPRGGFRFAVARGAAGAASLNPSRREYPQSQNVLDTITCGIQGRSGRVVMPRPAACRSGSIGWVTRLTSSSSIQAGNRPDADETPARHLAESVGRLITTASPEGHLPEPAPWWPRWSPQYANAAAERIEAEATDLLRTGEPSLELITEYRLRL